MEKVSPMISMAITPKTMEENVGIVSAAPIYPYGLCICLTNDELEKLDVDAAELSVGDHFHLHAIAQITSISQNDTPSGKNSRVELQIISLAGEDEEAENSQYEKEDRGFRPLG